MLSMFIESCERFSFYLKGNIQKCLKSAGSNSLNLADPSPDFLAINCKNCMPKKIYRKYHSFLKLYNSLALQTTVCMSYVYMITHI